MRLDLDKHLLTCPLRLETCEHCQIQVVATQLARHHVLICPKFPVNCPVCGEVEVMRENINSHINIINELNKYQYKSNDFELTNFLINLFKNF